MTLPPPLRTPAVRLLLVAYPALAGILPAAGRPWLTVPLCLVALAATGALWIRAVPGLPAETGVPAARTGFAAAAGLITMPLLALLLHAAGQPVRPLPLVVAGVVLVTLLGAIAVVRDLRAVTTTATTATTAGSGPDRTVRTAMAVTIPQVLAAGVGGWAVHAYLTAPHPPEPGYLSVALNGWAAAVDGPVTVPAQGLAVPVRVTSSGIADTTRLLQLRIGGRVVVSRPMTVAADSIRSLTVYVPALPPDGRLRNVAISVGATSIGFYARGHADSARAPRTTAGAAITGPGVAAPAPTTAAGGAVPPAVSGGDRTRDTGPRPAVPGGDRAGGTRTGHQRTGHQRTGHQQAGQLRTSRQQTGVQVRPHRDRADGVPLDADHTIRIRPTPARTGVVRTPSAAPGGIATPSTGTTSPRPAGGAPSGSSGPRDSTPGPAAPTTSGTAGNEDHTPPIGTKGGRARTGPVQTPGIGPDGSVWPVSPAAVVPDPSRVACSGKRRAVLAGEPAPC